MDVIYPITLFLVLGGLAIFLCARTYRGPEQGWLLRWLWVALTLRLIASAMFAAFPETRIFHEDADGYEWFGMAVARSWHGVGPDIRTIIPDLPQNYGYRYVTASAYYLFGQYPAMAACLNCVIGTINVFLVYHLARQFFHPMVARRAALLTALVPSMVLWNAIALKESIMSMLILVALVSCVSLKRRFSLASVLGVVAALLAMQPLRYYMVYFLFFAVVVSLFLERGLRLVGGVYKQIVLVGAIVILVAMIGMTRSVNEGAATLTFARVSSFRHGMAATAASGFDVDADVSTPGAALSFLPIGMAEFLLGPFPWQFGSLRALLAAPETVYWWLLFPSLIRGLIWSVRSRFADTSPLVLFAVTMTSAYSLMHGNVGSGFRQRSQIFIILFIFASFGVLKRRAERRGVDPNLLLADHLKDPVRPATSVRPAA